MSGETKIDMSDTQMRNLVYKMYRGMLGTYNEQANDILQNLPALQGAVVEDRGVDKKIEDLAKSLRKPDQAHNHTFTKDPIMTTPSIENGAGPPVPPPPPPPFPSGTTKLPCEISPRKEPPAAIQNAMLTKDKKPFTYTPGGIDLSEIKSPRIARRVQMNAMSPGVQSPATKPSPLIPPPMPPSAPMATNENQLPRQVLPPPPPMPPSVPIATSENQLPRHVLPPPPPPASNSLKHIHSPVASEPMATSVPSTPQSGFNTPKSVPSTPQMQQFSSPPSFSPQTPSTPVSYQVERPTPEPSKPKMNTNDTGRGNAQLGALYIPPIDTDSKNITGNGSPGSAGIPQLQKAPLPWMNSQTRHQSPPPIQFLQKRDNPPPMPTTICSPPTNTPQLKKNAPNWLPTSQDSQEQIRGGAQAGGQDKQARIIPISVEREDGSTYSTLPRGQTNPAARWQPQSERQTSVNNAAHGIQHMQITSPVDVRPGDETLQPTQSKSFRILQMITDSQDQTPVEPGPMSSHPPAASKFFATEDTKGQPRLLLSDGDKELMNMFKQQVDEDSFLHTTADPRYKGSCIPSRTFRLLQDWTSSNEDDSVPACVIPNTSQSVDVSPMASQQEQLPEPRKYTGGSIPSRSFRMLQQMTDDGTDTPPTSGSGYSTLAQVSENPNSPLKNHIGNRVGGESAVDSSPNVKPHKYRPSDIPSRIFHHLEQEYPEGNDYSASQNSSHGANNAANTADPPAPLEKKPSRYIGESIPSRVFKRLQGDLEQASEGLPAEDVVPSTTSDNEEETREDKMLKSKTFRSLQDNPGAHPSVFGRRAK